MTAKFQFLLNKFEIWKFRTFQWRKLKKSISQLPNSDWLYNEPLKRYHNLWWHWSQIHSKDFYFWWSKMYFWTLQKGWNNSINLLFYVSDGATTLSVLTFSKMTLHIKGLHATLSITTLSITALPHYAECRVLFNVMLNVVMLSVMTPTCDRFHETFFSVIYAPSGLTLIKA
jgi:hypothetical protein